MTPFVGPPWFDTLEVYPTPADLPAQPYHEGWLEVVLQPPSLYIYTSSGGHQLVAASTPTTPATPASDGAQAVAELASEAEAPVLVAVRDWTNDRHIFSILVWPALEVAPKKADYAQRERAKLVREVIAKGASEMMWGTRFETDYGLVWDSDRRTWIASDGYRYAPPESDNRAARIGSPVEGVRGGEEETPPCPNERKE